MTGEKTSGRHDGLAVVGWAAPVGGGFGKIFKIGKQPVNTQVLDGDIQVIFPEEFASAKPVFPMPS